MSDMDRFPEVEKRWFMHVGYLAQNWAAVELSLDGIARQLHLYYGSEKSKKIPPQPFAAKRDFIRNAFTAHPKLSVHSERLEELLNIATRLAEVRHWALHGGWAETNAEDALLGRYNRSEKLRWEQKRLSLNDIYKAAAECASLEIAFTFFAQLAFEVKTKEEIEQTLREIVLQTGTPFPGDDSAA